MTQLKLKPLLLATCAIALLAAAPIQAADPKPVTEAAGIIPVQLKAGKGTFLPLAGEANAVFVADPEIADVEMKFANMLYVYGVTPGETTVHVLDADGNIIASRTVQVVANVQELQTALRNMLPDSDITATPLNDRIVLKGNVRSPNQADSAMKLAASYVENDDALINMLDVRDSNQITLKVKVAEVQRSVTKNFGIDFQSSGFLNNAIRWGNFSPSALYTNPDATGLRSYAPGVFNGLDLTTGQGNYRSFLQFADGDITIDTFVQALERQGLLTLLAEPNLTAMSGEPASFLAGGEFPIVYVNNDQTLIEYRQFGVSLNFTPFVLSENRIRLKVNPEVSELSNQGAVELNGFNIPALVTRRAETTVELGNGETFSIAGIFQNSMRDGVTQYPWLGDLPILGTLFRSQNWQHDNTELLILVTPYVVEPVNSATAMKTPLDNTRIPTDSDRILYGQTTQSSLRPLSIRGVKTDNLAGPLGFMLD